METTIFVPALETLARVVAEGCVALALTLTACWLVAAGFRPTSGELETV